MSIAKVSDGSSSYRYNTEDVARNKKVDMTRQEQQKQAQAVQENRKTEEQWKRGGLKGGEVSLTV